MNWIVDLMGDRDLQVLAGLVERAARPGMVVVELGTFTGRSALGMLPTIRRMAGHLYCVDWFRGSPDSQGAGIESYQHYDVLTILRDNLREGGYEDCTTIIVGSSSSVAAIFPDESIDLAFIDADHRYSRVMADLLAWYPKVRVGGIICGHDFEKPMSECSFERLLEACEQDFVDGCHYGVIRAVSECFPQVTRDGRVWWAFKDNTAPLAAHILAVPEQPRNRSSGG